MNPHRLYRCRYDRKLAGVAAGMAEYLDVDPTLVRVLWIVSVFFGGFSILLYLILAFVMPLEPGTPPGPGSWHPAAPAWGVPPTSGAGTQPADAVPGGASDPGPGAPFDAGTANYAWPRPWHDRRPDTRRRSGRAGLYAGITLVVLGAIAMINSLVPGWAGNVWLGPALLVALGVALLAGSIRRPDDRGDGRPSTDSKEDEGHATPA